MLGPEDTLALTGHPVIPINPANGFERPRPVAFIDEQLCIGCTLCIQACPVDAIVGAAKQMHTILPSLCTGCDLCVAPCPVDCIELVPATGTRTGWQAWSPQQADESRLRYEAHRNRLERDASERHRPTAAPSLSRGLQLAYPVGIQDRDDPEVDPARRAPCEPLRDRGMRDIGAGVLPPDGFRRGSACRRSSSARVWRSVW